MATVRGTREATHYLRRGNLVARITVVMPEATPGDAGQQALTIATELALAVSDNADDSPAGSGARCG